MKNKISYRMVWNVAKVILAITFIFILISKISYQQLQAIKKDIIWEWLIVSFLLFILLILVKAYQYNLLLASNTRYRDILRIIIWQNVISNFVVTAAGIASYMAMLKTEQNINLTRSGTTFLVTKFGDLLAICLYLALSGGLVWNQILALKWLTLLLVAGMLFGLTIFLAVSMWRERIVVQITKLLSWLKLSHLPQVKRGLSMLRSLAQEEQKVILTMLRRGVFVSIIYMTVTMAASYISVLLFDIQVSLWAVVYVTSLMQLISLVPIQVLGGLGVSEVTSVYLYSLFGVNQNRMSAVVIGLRVLFYLMNLGSLLYLPVCAILLKEKT